jgi:hypothetical protein
MLYAGSYPQDYVDTCRATIESQIEAFRTLDAPGVDVEAAFFNNLVLVLDHYFVHRGRNVEGKDGNPLNEVRVLADSLMSHGGVLTANKSIRLKPQASVLGYAPGDEIRLDEAGFRRLADGFLAEIERRYPAPVLA